MKQNGEEREIKIAECSAFTKKEEQLTSTLLIYSNNFKLTERMSKPSYSANYFIDDQEQVRLTYQTYKTVFCNTTNKGYILYRYNSLKRAKQVIKFIWPRCINRNLYFISSMILVSHESNKIYE